MIKINQRALEKFKKFIADLESGIFEQSVRSLAQDSINKVEEALKGKFPEKLIPQSRLRKILPQSDTKQLRAELFKSVVGALARRFRQKVTLDVMTIEQRKVVTRIFQESVVKIQALIHGVI